MLRLNYVTFVVPANYVSRESYVLRRKGFQCTFTYYTCVHFVTESRNDLHENIQLCVLHDQGIRIIGCEFFRESQQTRQIDSNPGILAQFNGSSDRELTSEK